MTQQKIPNQWQLQNTGEQGDQWMLREEEQQLPSHMQLQDDAAGPVMVDTHWQPIDYQAMQAAAQQRPRRGGLALTGLVVLVLIGVGSYLTWFYLGQPGLNAPTDSSRTGNAPAVIAPAVETPAVDLAEPTPVVEVPAALPVATDVPPVPTVPPVSPTPALVEVRQATVDSQYGVNLREAASSTSTLVRVLDSGTTHLVVSGPVTDAEGNAWYELASAGGTRGWASGGFIRIASQTLPYDQAVPLYQAAGVDPPAAPAAPDAVDASEPPAAAASTAPVTDTSPLTVSTAVAASPAAGPAVTLTGVISAPAGLNFRREPATGDNVIQMLDDQTPVTVIGRSQDGQWTQVELADNRRGWVAAQFVTVTGSIDSIPLGTVQPLTQTVTAAASAAPAVASAATTATTPSTAAPSTTATTGIAGASGLGTVIVTSVLGVNVRAQPNDAMAVVQLNWNATASAIGRTADSEWVQVRLEDGTTGWVKASAVSVANGIASLPVTQ
jgi:uncharacterized protein YgiM (DUF1202 family)